MSLVGPRPDTPEYVQLYDDRQRGVLRVRPGITSPASIAFHNEEDLLVAAAADGRRTPAEVYRDVIMPKELDLDLEYVDNWSLRRDFEILMRTAALAARRVGALPRELRHD
jgi:lipopolysaccharide/colanic/teichoic acid biosynthesis glycosyltransferase